MTLNERIVELEKQVSALMSQVQTLSSNTEEKYSKPISIVGGQQDKPASKPIDIKVGSSRRTGGPVIWNSEEAKNPPVNAQPPNPEAISGSKGYNKHSHSRYSGGALIKDVLEIVEYVWGAITNKHSQQYWSNEPTIATDVNSNGETVQKLGKLELIFNPDGGYDNSTIPPTPIGMWGISTYEINVKKCYLVKRRTTDGSLGEKIGDIEKDSKGQEMKSLLYNDDTTKTSLVWDENAGVWRFYAVYAVGEN